MSIVYQPTSAGQKPITHIYRCGVCGGWLAESHGPKATVPACKNCPGYRVNRGTGAP